MNSFRKLPVKDASEFMQDIAQAFRRDCPEYTAFVACNGWKEVLPEQTQAVREALSVIAYMFKHYNDGTMSYSGRIAEIDLKRYGKRQLYEAIDTKYYLGGYECSAWFSVDSGKVQSIYLRNNQTGVTRKLAFAKNNSLPSIKAPNQQSSVLLVA